jgi:glycosyltransferase involved in cell wall biosynthesis
MACGVPVVGADAQGVRDVVGDSGIVVPRDDPIALGDALGALLDDEERRAELARRARRRVEETFALRVVGAQLRSFLIERRSP